jgi:cytochrome P450
MTNAITRAPFEYDLFSPEVQEDPYAVYAHLLAQGPVYYNERRDFYALARFDDVEAALRDWQGFSSSAGVRPDDLLQLQGPSIIAMVPPRHRQLRQVVQPAFHPAQVARLEPLVEQKALKLLEGVEHRDEVDIVDAFVKRLPVLVICELMGVPERDAEMLKHWADEIVECSAVDGTTPESARAPAKALRDYFIDQLGERRRRPGEDLISRLVATADSGEPGGLDEAVGMCNLLFEAGNSTTSSLIGNSLFALAAHPDERVWANEHPGAWPGTIEELLRYDAPVQNMSRALTGAVSVDGVPIPAGATVVLVLGAADRDPRVWDAPDELRLSREPHRNLAFGAGIHHCVGAPLARLEGRVALPLLLSRMGEYEVVSAERAHDINLHMFKKLVLRPGLS